MSFRNNGNGKMKTVIIILACIAIVGIVAYLLWKKGYLAKAKNWIKDKVTPGTGVIEPEKPEACTFPVTLNSSPGCILTAMEKSGYMDAQKQWWIDQTGDMDTISPTYNITGSQYIAKIYSDPVADLRSHPYVYSLYPSWFASV
jgi:hypothetical protein